MWEKILIMVSLSSQETPGRVTMTTDRDHKACFCCCLSFGFFICILKINCKDKCYYHCDAPYLKIKITRHRESECYTILLFMVVVFFLFDFYKTLSQHKLHIFKIYNRRVPPACTKMLLLLIHKVK